MKSVGLGLIAAGAAVLVFLAYSFFKNQNTVRSPIPTEEGVKVIFVTPSQ